MVQSRLSNEERQFLPVRECAGAVVVPTGIKFGHVIIVGCRGILLANVLGNCELFSILTGTFEDYPRNILLIFQLLKGPYSHFLRKATLSM
jgi:hypothetical protein